MAGEGGAEISQRWFKILLPGLHGDQEAVLAVVLGAGLEGRRWPCLWGAEQLSCQGLQRAGAEPWGAEGSHGPRSGTAGCSHTSTAGTHTPPDSQGQELHV